LKTLDEVLEAVIEESRQKGLQFEIISTNLFIEQKQKLEVDFGNLDLYQ